ncbi:MAG: hypothetical protein ABJ360_18170, partial [Roseobacter sp.]
MHQYRITKYDPGKRDQDGAYLVDDWTCAGDIGRKFQGEELAAADYLRMEDNYVRAMLRFFDASGLPHLRVTCLENRFADENLARIETTWPDLIDPAIVDLVLHEDQEVCRNEIGLICRMVLRNIIWCKLEFAGRFFVHFGWDFYMYIGVVPDASVAARQAEANGLFVENFTSPHGRRQGTVPLILLEVCKADGGEHCRDIELAGVSIGSVRNAIGFSAEHPVDGSFALDPTQVTRIGALTAETLDALRFSYNLDTTG